MPPSSGPFHKGYVRRTAGGKRVMWDGNRWQQLCQIEKCLKRDQKSNGVCFIHLREQQENAKKKNKKTTKKRADPIRKNKSKATVKISTRSKRFEMNNSLDESAKASDSDNQDTDATMSDSNLNEPTSSASTSSLNNPLKSSQSILLVCSSLTRHQLSQVDLFCKQFSIRLSSQVDETTTHLITHETRPGVCCLTKKVILSVANHQFIVGYRWIEACLREQCLLSEDPYEIVGDASLSSDHNGMHLSRLAHRPIFESYAYAFAVECSTGCQQGMFTRQEIEELVQKSGAILLQNDFRSQLKINTIIVVLCDDGDTMVCKKFADFKQDIHYVIPEFFLDSIIQYEIQPIEDYEQNLCV